MIALYLENQRLDTDESLSISFTYETIDPDRLSSIKNSFSKTVAIKGTPNNNRIFGHIFRNDKYIPVDTNDPDRRIGPYFDPHRQTRWTMTNKGAYVGSGYCTLDNIVRKGTDITYNLTLYGGIGGFFYNLKYNADGTKRSLSDMFWNWYPRTSAGGYGQALDQASESTDPILRCTADVITSSYLNLSPDNPYTGTTGVDKDITFVPCYTGLYDDFDSKSMLVSTYNHTTDNTSVIAKLPAAIRKKLRDAFPDSKTEGGVTYTALDKHLSTDSQHRYGVVSFSRDIDPSEAGDLRVGELPTAVRLSKLMTVISNPDNNGGYDVEWDSSITSSYHWRYGWVLLGNVGKTKREVDNIVMTLTHPRTINADYVSGDDKLQYTNAPLLDTMTLSGNSLSAGAYYFNATIQPKIVAKCSSFSDYEFSRMFSGQVFWDLNVRTQRRVWNTVVILHCIYSDSSQSNLIATKADLFYFSQNEETALGKIMLPTATQGTVLPTVKRSIAARISSEYNINLTADDIIIHECKANTYSLTYGPDGVDVNLSYDDVETRFKFITSSDLNDISVVQNQILMCTVFQAKDSLTTNTINSGIYIDDFPGNYIDVTAGPTPNGSLFSIYGKKTNIYAKSYWNDQSSGSHSSSFEITMNVKEPSSITSGETTGYDVTSLTKKDLFASSMTPYDYIVGFCKMMNYRITYDDINSKVMIAPINKYYIRDNVISLDDNAISPNVKSDETLLLLDTRVDYSRDISISPIVTKYHKVRLGLNTPKTYPVDLFDRLSNAKFNEVAFDTGVNTVTAETNLLDGVMYDNVIDWQQSSVFHNIFPQIPRAASTPTVSWKLFNVGATGEIVNTKELITPGFAPIGTLPTVDFLPKIALFDKDNKKVDFNSALIFLNGFVRNYDYTQVDTDGSREKYIISPRVMLSDDTDVQYYLNEQRCYIYDFAYNGTLTAYGYFSGRGTAASWVLPFFSRDLYNYCVNGRWTPSPDILASWNIAYQPTLANVYKLINTTFVTQPRYVYSPQTDTLPTENEYSIYDRPSDQALTRIFDRNWRPFLSDMYDRNTRNITCYVDLRGLGDANTVMRGIYRWHGDYWIITKIYDYRIGDRFDSDKFTKVTLHKVVDVSYLVQSKV